MKLDLSRYFPVGIERRRELRRLLYAALAALLYSMGFLVRLAGAHGELYTELRDGTRVLIKGAVAEDFARLLRGSMIGFWVMAGAALLWASYFYGYHYQGSRSIYLMRRLPQRGELHRRCLAFPIFSVLALLLLMALTTAAYFLIYMSVMPAECVRPGQLGRLFGF
ncbi:MAG: hypothetical protein IJU78_08030 [Clostridia bacterium]|nr:hypothetical protein [Clostridia bacterium]